MIAIAYGFDGSPAVVQACTVHLQAISLNLALLIVYRTRQAQIQRLRAQQRAALVVQVLPQLCLQPALAG